MENQVCADVSRETFIDFCADCDRLLSACFQEKNIFAVMPADRRKSKAIFGTVFHVKQLLETVQVQNDIIDFCITGCRRFIYGGVSNAVVLCYKKEY